MTMHSAAFIDLNRTFSKIPVDADVSDDLDLSGRHSRHGNLHWADLLGHQRVILLSEAGSGKTAEIRNVTRQLRSEGKNAFFLLIENVSLGWEDSIEDEYSMLSKVGLTQDPKAGCFWTQLTRPG
jgi:type II secretory pathway predicted ATPase ExeA